MFEGGISKISNTVIIIWMLALFLSFGLVANFLDSEGFFYNLLQGIFISGFVGGAFYLGSTWLADENLPQEFNENRQTSKRF